MSIADLARSNRGRAIGISIAVALVVGGVTTASVATAQANAEEQARIELAAAEAREVRLVVLRLAALDVIGPMGMSLADDAAAWAESGSALLTEKDVAALQSTADAVTASFDRVPADDAASTDLADLYDSQWAMILGARERMDVVVGSALAAARVSLGAAPIADAASRQSVVDSIAALESTWSQHGSIAEPLTGLTASAARVTASQEAAVAAAAAAAAAVAAAAKARRGGGGGGSAVLTAVNKYRAAAGVGPLVASSALNTTASACATRMATNNSFTHSPYPGGTWAENIAKGYGSAQAVVDAWFNSPGHKTNMLNPAYTRMGIGNVSSGNWWCQQFG